jgi:hypothetical protein
LEELLSHTTILFGQGGKMSGKQEAVKTYVEQTKLLVTLASGFVLAPAAAVSFFRPSGPQPAPHLSVNLFVIAEILLILSVLSGYLVLGSIAGSEHSEEFNVYRRATRILSVLQVLLYLAGLCFFVILMRIAVKSP